MNPAKLIALYLPQFHAIAENDQWWGKGFTEWVNVRGATPGFEGHYQPHEPVSPLEYYDLSNPRAQQMQAHMARRYGIHGFCYYYYWFGGKKLLQTPIETMLASGRPDLPFCICWANHDWTRAWYGQNKQVLMAQDYSDESMRAFVEDVAPLLADGRYIRVDQKPMLCVYQSEEMPNSKRITDIWRERAHKLGLGELHLVRMEALDWDRDPATLGFDAAVEFAPDWRMAGQLLNPGQQPRRVDYKTTVTNMLLKPPAPYTRYHGVFPGWDNSPRYKKAALVFDNASPGVFAYHLENAIRKTMRNTPDNRLVFINAWNEWGEGCHLEPCRRHGTAWLEACRMALQRAVQHAE
jgi:lipopolysaccharide biosynthesis protein